jgi:hypothetical protein
MAAIPKRAVVPGVAATADRATRTTTEAVGRTGAVMAEAAGEDTVVDAVEGARVLAAALNCTTQFIWPRMI